MADDLFAHADQVEARAAIEAAERARKEAEAEAIKNRRAKTLDYENALRKATHDELQTFVEARKRLAGAKH